METDCCTVPTVSVRCSWTFWPTVSATPVRLSGANPSRVTETVYTPTATDGAEKVPPSAVTNLRSLPVSSLRISTSACATAEPAGSTTSPEMVPPTICALAQGVTAISIEVREYRTRRITNSSWNFFGGERWKQLAATTKPEGVRYDSA